MHGKLFFTKNIDKTNINFQASRQEATRTQQQEITSTKTSCHTKQGEMQENRGFKRRLDFGQDQGQLGGMFNNKNGAKRPRVGIQYELDMAKAMENSMNEVECKRLQEEQVVRSLEYVCERYNLSLQAAGTLIPPNGDCLFSSAALARNPSLRGEKLQEQATFLRCTLVQEAIETIDSLSREEYQLLHGAANLPSQATREDFKEALGQYLSNGVYDGDIGDVLPFILSSFLGTPLLIIQVGQGSHWVSPKNVFNQPLLVELPIVLVRRGEHYEVLLVPEGEEENLKRKFQWSQEDNQAGERSNTEDRSSHSPEASSTRRGLSKSPSTLGNTIHNFSSTTSQISPKKSQTECRNPRCQGSTRRQLKRHIEETPNCLLYYTYNLMEGGTLVQCLKQQSNARSNPRRDTLNNKKNNARNNPKNNPKNNENQRQATRQNRRGNCPNPNCADIGTYDNLKPHLQVNPICVKFYRNKHANGTLAIDLIVNLEQGLLRNETRKRSRNEKAASLNHIRHSFLMEVTDIMQVPCCICETYKSKTSGHKNLPIAEVPKEDGYKMEKAAQENAPNDRELLRYRGYELYWCRSCSNYIEKGKKRKQLKVAETGESSENDYIFKFIPQEETNLQRVLREEDDRVEMVLMNPRNQILCLSLEDYNISPSTTILDNLRRAVAVANIPFQEGINNIHIEESFPPLRSLPSFDLTLSITERSRKILDVFKFSSFKSDSQREAIASLLSGRDTLLIEPTGGGKSFVGQGPALEAESKVTIFIAPLTSLIQDQYNNFRMKGFPAMILHGKMSHTEQNIVYKYLESMPIGVLYVTPERTVQPLFRAWIQRLIRGDKVAYVVVDEAHCITQWGRDFRRDYLRLEELRMITEERSVPWLALTATATEQVKEHIQKTLRFSDRCGIFETNPIRKNIYCDVKFRSEINDPVEHLVKFLRKCLSMEHEGDQWEGCAIVYCHRIQDTERLASKLRMAGLLCHHYHGSMGNAQRRKVQEAWTRGDIPIILATNAFGMGIDKSNVRGIAHNNVPLSMHAYYQEIGRAGRDGRQSWSRIYYDRKQTQDHADILLKTWKSKRNEGLEGEIARDNLQHYDKMVGFCLKLACRHQAVADHFGHENGPCKEVLDVPQCDMCKEPEDTTEYLLNHKQDKQRKAKQVEVTRGVAGELSGYGTEDWPEREEEHQECYRRYEERVLTVLVPASQSVLSLFENVTFDNMKEAQMWLTREQTIPNLTSLNSLYLCLIELIKKAPNKNNTGVEKFGKVLDAGRRTLQLKVEERGKQKQFHSLSRVPLTGDNLQRRRQESKARLHQNGSFHIQVEVVIQEGVDDNLAASQIPHKISLKFEENKDGQVIGVQYLEPCIDISGKICDIDSCLRQHRRSSEITKKQKYAKPFMIPKRTKSICDKASLIVRKIFCNGVQHHDLWLEFFGDTVLLRGNIHPTTFNRINRQVAVRGGEEIWKSTEQSKEGLEAFREKLRIVEQLEEEVATLNLMQPSVTNEVQDLTNKCCLEEAGSRGVLQLMKESKYARSKEITLPSIVNFYAMPLVSPYQSREGLEAAKNIKGNIRMYLDNHQQASILEVLGSIQIKAEESTSYTKVATISINGCEPVQIETCKEIIKFIMKKLRRKVKEDESEIIYSRALVWLHVIGYLTSANNGWIVERRPSEQGARQYDPKTTYITGQPSFVRVVGPGEDKLLPCLPDIRERGGIKFMEVNIHEFFAKAAYKLTTNWTTDTTVYVETRDLTGQFRRFREIKNQDEEVGNQPVFLGANGEKLVLGNSTRDRCWKLKRSQKMPLAQLAIWYGATKEMSVEQADLDIRKIDGMPKYVVLTDRKTVLKRKEKPAVLIQSSHDEYAEKLLYHPWEEEQEVDNLPEVTWRQKVDVFPKLTSSGTYSLPDESFDLDSNEEEDYEDNI